MPKVIPQEVRLKAMELFIQGEKAKTISERLEEDFDVEVKPPTIYAWAKKMNWKAKKTEVETEAVQQIQETETQRFGRLQQEHLNLYEEMRHKAHHDLDGLYFDRASDAARIVDLSIAGERKVMEGMINLQFIQDVLNVLVEEVNDEDTLNRVAMRLKTLVQQET